MCRDLFNKSRDMHGLIRLPHFKLSCLYWNSNGVTVPFLILGSAKGWLSQQELVLGFYSAKLNTVQLLLPGHFREMYGKFGVLLVYGNFKILSKFSGGPSQWPRARRHHEGLRLLQGDEVPLPGRQDAGAGGAPQQGHESVRQNRRFRGKRSFALQTRLILTLELRATYKTCPLNSSLWPWDIRKIFQLPISTKLH